MFVVVAGVAILAALVLFLRSGDDVEIADDRVELEGDSEASDEPGGDDSDGEGVEPGVDSETEDELDFGFGPPPSQEDRSPIEVANGAVDEFEGEINENQFDVFEIDVERGDELVVSVESSEFDTLLRAVDPTGDQVAGNDDADATAGLASSLDSQIAFLAETTGTYGLEILSYDAEASGEYLLTVDRTGEGVVPDGESGDLEFEPALNPGSAGLEDAAVLTIAPNGADAISGALDDPAAYDSYTFQLEAGETVSITAEANPEGELDTFITVVDGAGGVVAINDDAAFDGVVGQATDSQLELRVVEAGDYSVQVASYASISSGEYTLGIQRSAGDGGGAPPVDELLELDSSLFIDPGETLVVDGSVETETFYDLLLEAGDRITVTVESADPAAFDPAVFLSFGVYDVAANDDAPSSSALADPFDSQIDITTANTGIHTIAVLGFGGSTGDFTMTVQRN